MLLPCVAVLSALAWLWLALLHGRFWDGEPELPVATPERPARVAVVIPARDEAEHIEAAVRSLLLQRFAGELCVIVVDDNSSDGTGQILQGLAAESTRLRAVQGQPLAAGWTGKMWAVHQGLRQPEVARAEFVLLTDADIVHDPSHLASLVAQAQAGHFDLVSEMVRLQCATAAEKATIPAFVFFFSMLYPFHWVGDPRRATAGAAGGTMLLSRAALDRIGGVDRIRTELIDDCALAREVKRGGHRIWLGHATAATSQRAYTGFAEVWNMVARTAYVQLGYAPLLLAGTCAGMLLLYAAPVLLALGAHGTTRAVGAGTWLLMALLFGPTLRRYRRSPLWGLALPAIALFYLGATLHSALRFYRGRGGQWKNRTYPAV